MNNSFVCERCEKAFTRKDNLQRHMKGCRRCDGMRNHQIAPAKKLSALQHICNLCEAEFISKNQLLKHLDLVHPRTKVLTEVNVNHSIPQRRAVDKLSVKFLCEKCDDFFTESRQIRDHYLKMHGIDWVAICGQCCGKKTICFTSKQKYKRHLEESHSESPECREFCEMLQKEKVPKRPVKRKAAESLAHVNAQKRALPTTDQLTSDQLHFDTKARLPPQDPTLPHRPSIRAEFGKLPGRSTDEIYQNWRHLRTDYRLLDPLMQYFRVKITVT